MSKDLLCEMKRPSSTKEMMEIEIFKFLRYFSRIQIRGKRYKANKRAEPCPTPMSSWLSIPFQSTQA